MSLQADIIARLVTLATAAADRVHHEVVPQGVILPFMATTEASSSRTLTLDRAPLLARAHIQVAVFSRSGEEIEAIIGQIETDLNGFHGQLGGTLVSSVRVERSPDRPEIADGQILVKGKSLDLFLVYY